ncbi:ExeM/NucH family extracellular endonuclease [Runella aurantiaca]|uniref:T9SS C-terminal target domain-containing protein n=1 Tax=Runella aurantiaca TaxID=2282308 RepID=A0A369I2P2_9BACT|nr:ExeM/NucH family extracellular endonuclease [Runella aurantiaca]RDB02525.1 T9SS C-terminal target domain-containing protein [Runella aurantiaca]
MTSILPPQTHFQPLNPVRWLQRLGSFCLLVLLLAVSTVAWSQAPTELFISEYIEGSSNNKAIEIYNGTGSAINLMDGGYNIQMYFNGNSASTLTINLTGTVASNDVFVIAQASSNAAILAQADQTNGSGWFNGDDVVVLRKGTTIIDVIGIIGNDPGTEWGSGLTSTADNTLRRKVSICGGEVNGSDAFNPATEWDGFANDTFDGLGTHTATCGPVTPTLSINDVSKVEGNTGTTTYSFTVSLNVAAGAGGVTFDIATADNTASAGSDYVTKSLTGQTIPQGSNSYSFEVVVNGDETTEPNETFFVNVTNVTGATAGDTQGQGTIQNDDIAVSKIHEIQGSGTTTPFAGTTVAIEGIVTRTFLNSTRLNGFYVQEEDADTDGNPATSEGIFVFDPAQLFSGNIGDRVKVTGKAAEFTSSGSSLTQLNELVSVQNAGAATLPAITNVQLPVSDVNDLERYEGMLVELSAATGNLTVTELFQLGRFGQLVLSANGDSNQPGTDARLDQYTQFNTPSVAGYSDYLAQIAKRKIYLDDGVGSQNPDPIIFGRGGNPLSASNTLRTGDEVASVVGVLDHRFEGYRIQTLTSPNFMATNARPAAPPTLGGTLKVASFNVLNYFNGNGLGGGFPTSRGADNVTEFNRQRDKILNAIIASGADVIGLMEIENDGFGATSAIQDLVNGLNGIAGVGTYSFINSGNISTDEITVAMIYKPAAVSPVGDAKAIPFDFGSGSFTVVGRRSLAQTFQQVSTDEVFTAVVNHLKSKGSSSGGVGDADSGDGQGFSNGTRTRQAQDVAAWLLTNPTGTTDPDYLILGDLNAYAKEDPLTAFANAGFGSLLPLTSYSYVFDGQLGSLDHALGSSAMASQVTGAEKWHINADEPTVLDYNTEFKTAGLVSSLYSTEPYRASDHDPVLVGLNLCTPPTITNVVVTQPTCLTATGSVVITATGTGTLEYNLNNIGWQESNTFSGLTSGNYTLVVRSKANTSCSTTYASNPVVVNAAPLVPSVFSVSGGGGKCSGNNGNGVVPSFTITLSGSQTNVNYQLLRNGSPVGSAVAGTGGSLTFTQTEQGAYTVSATSTTGCTSAMTGEAIIYTNSRPDKFKVSGGGNYCVGSAGVEVGMEDSEAGVNYLLKKNNVSTGILVAGTGNAISFGLQPAGTYTVDAINAATGCDANMNGSAVVLAKNCNGRVGAETFDSDDSADTNVWAAIAPNPVIGRELTLLIKGMSGKTVEWQLLNVQGSVAVSSRFVSGSNAHRQTLSVPQLAAGSYLLNVQSNGKSLTLKVMKAE